MKVWQNDLGAKAEVRSFFCGVLCVCAIAEKKGKQVPQTTEEMNQLYDDLVQKKIIKSDCYISSWDKLFAYFGLKTVCEYMPTSYSPRELVEDVIEKWAFEEEHFVTADYDPWKPRSKTCKMGKMKAKLVIRYQAVVEEPVKVVAAVESAVAAVEVPVVAAAETTVEGE